MNKIAIVHLYCNGYSSEDLLDFKLMLSNPSTIAQQQKLELKNVKKKQLFKKGPKAKNVAGTSPRKHLVSPIKSEAAKKKAGEDFIRG